MRMRTIFFLILAAIIIGFLYIERAILTPFVLAAIFAYIFNPLVNFFTHKVKLPRTLSVAFIYILLLLIVITISINLGERVINESDDLKHYTNNLITQTKSEVASLPSWAQGWVNDGFRSVEKSKFLTSNYLFSLFPKVFSHILSFIIFLFSGFYFLKEGSNIFEKFIVFIPRSHKVEVEILFRKINLVLGRYLRGQLFLIFFVAIILFILLSLLGVRFSLIIALFSGIAEIVPIIGPFVAAGVAIITVLITGNANFSLTPLQAALIIALIYLIVRQFQDYFVTPFVLGKVTKLPAIIILFAVLAGEHLMGLLGMILAVPIAAALKILLEFSLDMVAQQDKKSTKNPRK